MYSATALPCAFCTEPILSQATVGGCRLVPLATCCTRPLGHYAGSREREQERDPYIQGQAVPMNQFKRQTVGNCLLQDRSGTLGLLQAAQIRGCLAEHVPDCDGVRAILSCIPQVEERQRWLSSYQRGFCCQHPQRLFLHPAKKAASHSSLIWQEVLDLD